MSTQPQQPAPASGGGEQYFRLPSELRARHYDLAILSDLDALRFSGCVTVELDVVRPTDRIVLNAGAGLNMHKAVVHADALKTEAKSVVELDIDAAHERVTAKLGAQLPAGSQARITIAFEAEIEASMMGYYRSTFEHEGKKGFYGLTQFEPTAARRAFPCFDEPDAKATYAFQMIHRSDSVALANMPVESTKPISRSDADKLLRLEELGVKAGVTEVAKTGKTESAAEPADGGAWSLTSYEKLPLVSSYLVAWANGPFKALESSFVSPITGKTVPIKIYATGEYIHQAQYALDVTAKVTPIYEKIFKIAYPLPKLDTLVASDFDAGAMENWGLITGRTSVYLYDAEKSGLQGQKRTASVQSHELAHQWFGNITTMAFWNGLWLNEAFATLMGEVVVLDRAFPEWDSATEFIALHLERAFELDSKRSSHAIELPLKGDNVEDAINQIFDAISYSKGASVLRMLSGIVGEEVFLDGVSRYLKKHLYANATTEDLWAGISEASGLDVKRIMHNWVLKIGYPVVTVEEKADSIVVRQNRFLSTGDVKPEEDETLWYVPLQIKTVGPQGAQVDSETVLDLEREREIPLKDAPNAIWKLNAGTTGVYRVAYSPERLAKLGAEAAKADGAFSLQDICGLVSDSFTLAKATDAKTSGSLALQYELRNNGTYLVQSMMSTNLSQLASVWYEAPQPVRDAVDAFRADVFGPTAKRMGFDFAKDDSPDTKQLRAVAIAAAASAGDEWTLGECKNRFSAFMKSGKEEQIHPDLLRTVYGQAVKYGGEAEYEAVLAVYRKPPTPTHKIAAHLALCASQDPKLIQRTIDFTFTDEVKTQDVMYSFVGCAGNPHARRPIWEATKKHYDELTRRFSGNFSLANIIKFSFSSLASEADVKDVEAFFADKATSKFSMALSQGLDSVRANARWHERDAVDVEHWLRAQGYLK